MVTFILIPRPGLATRVVALICFLAALLFQQWFGYCGKRMEPGSVSPSDARHLWSNAEFHEFEECPAELALI